MREAKHVMQRSRLAARDEARRPVTRVQLPGKSEIIFDGGDAPFQLGTNNERRLNPKNRIALQKFIAFEEQMSDEGAKARRADHEVNMRGPERMSLHCLEQLTGGTIIRNRIAARWFGIDRHLPRRSESSP